MNINLTSQQRELIGRLLGNILPDWNSLSQQAKQVQGTPPFKTALWAETEVLLTKNSLTKGQKYDFWEMPDGICLYKHPSFLEKLFGWLLPMIDVLFFPVRWVSAFIENSMKALLERLFAKFNNLAFFLAAPLLFLASSIDAFLRVFSVFFTAIIKAILSLSLWQFIRAIVVLIPNLILAFISRFIAMIFEPIISGIIERILRIQNYLVELFARYPILRAVLLGYFRQARPAYPVIIARGSVKQTYTTERWHLTGKKKYLVLVEGDAFEPSFNSVIFYLVMNSLLPYYWERTIHMIALPDIGSEEFIDKINTSLAPQPISNEGHEEPPLRLIGL